MVWRKWVNLLRESLSTRYADLFPDDLELVTVALGAALQASLGSTADHLRIESVPGWTFAQFGPDWDAAAAQVWATR